MTYTDENMKIASWLAYKNTKVTVIEDYLNEHGEYPTVLEALKLSGINIQY